MFGLSGVVVLAVLAEIARGPAVARGAVQFGIGRVGVGFQDCEAFEELVARSAASKPHQPAHRSLNQRTHHASLATMSAATLAARERSKHHNNSRRRSHAISRVARDWVRRKMK